MGFRMYSPEPTSESIDSEVRSFLLPCLPLANCRFVSSKTNASRVLCPVVLSRCLLFSTTRRVAIGSGYSTHRTGTLVRPHSSAASRRRWPPKSHTQIEFLQIGFKYGGWGSSSYCPTNKICSCWTHTVPLAIHTPDL
jgi:hypothetical protein